MSQKRLAEERAAKNVCIICEDGGGRITRGLCIKHHTRYVTSRKQIPVDRRDAYDEFLVENGLLLPSRKGRRVDPDENEFALAMSEFLSNSSPASQLAEEFATEDAAKRLAAEIGADAEAEQEENPVPEKPTSAPAVKKSPKRGRAGGKRKG